MDEKRMLELQIRMMGKDLGLSSEDVDRALGIKSVDSEKDQVALQNAKLEGFSKTQSITKAQQDQLDKQAADAALLNLLKTGKLKPDDKFAIANPKVAQDFVSGGGEIMTASSADEKKKKLIKKEIVDNATELVRVMEQGKNGTLKGDAYKSAYDSAVSRFAAAQGFTEGGKALTGPELSVLAGAMPVRRQQNILEKATGYLPTGVESLQDSPEQIYRKALYAMQQSENKRVKEHGKKMYDKVEGLARTGGPSLGEFAGNVGTDAKDILNGVLNIPKNIMESNVQRMQQGQGPHDIFSLGGEMGKGIINEANELTGRPLEGGDVVGRIGQRMYEKPVTTALDILPFLKIRGGNPKVLAPAAEEGNIVSKTGSKLRASARNIDVGPSVYGPSSEARINATLDRMGVKGNARQQYAQLQPKITQVSGEIKSYLAENAVPIQVKDVKTSFVKNVKELLPEEKLAVPSIEREVAQVMKELGKDSNKLTTADIFDIKTKLNASYSRVANKLKNGSPLTDKEKVIYAMRKSVDEIITSNHPNIKEQTLAQSDLYEAADSLYAQRTNVPKINLFGLNIPLSQNAGGIRDALGRILQGGR